MDLQWKKNCPNSQIDFARIFFFFLSSSLSPSLAPHVITFALCLLILCLYPKFSTTFIFFGLSLYLPVVKFSLYRYSLSSFISLSPCFSLCLPILYILPIVATLSLSRSFTPQYFTSILFSPPIISNSSLYSPLLSASPYVQMR